MKQVIVIIFILVIVPGTECYGADQTIVGEWLGCYNQQGTWCTILSKGVQYSINFCSFPTPEGNCTPDEIYDKYLENESLFLGREVKVVGEIKSNKNSFDIIAKSIILSTNTSYTSQFTKKNIKIRGTVLDNYIHGEDNNFYSIQKGGTFISNGDIFNFIEYFYGEQVDVTGDLIRTEPMINDNNTGGGDLIIKQHPTVNGIDRIDPCGKIAEMFNLGSNYTSIQRDRMERELKGKKVIYKIPIYEIMKNDKYFTVVSVGSGRCINIIATIQPLHDFEEEYMYTLKTGSYLSIKGTIKGISMRNLVIEPAFIYPPEKVEFRGD